MHIHFLDPYKQGASPIHRLDPRVKVILTLAFILTTTLTPPAVWAVYILLFSLILSIELLSALGISYVHKRAVLALPFILAALPLVFITKEAVVGTFTIGLWTLSISQTGLERFLSIALKSWISVQAAVVLTSSTPFPELLVGLRAIKTPRLLVAVFRLMWRYLFVLADEVLRLKRARDARSGISERTDIESGGSLVWRAQIAGGMVGNLLIRAIERSDRIYNAMLSRGYDGEVRSAPLPNIRISDWILVIISISVFIVLLIMSQLFYA